MGKQRPDGLYVTAGQLMGANQRRIVDFALTNRVPSIYSFGDVVDLGGLMSYGADQTEIYRRVAYFVD